MPDTAIEACATRQSISGDTLLNSSKALQSRYLGRHVFSDQVARRYEIRSSELPIKGNADGFYRAILAEGDRRRICGLPPMYTWLRLISPGEIRLLKYDQAFNPQATVTFASIGAWS